jgi:hypothetical protein
MRIGRGNRSTRKKPASVPPCSPQIPRDLTWARTQAASVGSLSYGAALSPRNYYHLIISQDTEVEESFLLVCVRYEVSDHTMQHFLVEENVAYVVRWHLCCSLLVIDANG